MLELMGNGGFGDCLVVFARVFSLKAPFKVNLNDTRLTFFTNVRAKSTLGVSIPEFYESQGINCRMVFGGNGASWVQKNRQDFDYYLSGRWHGKNRGEDNWEINPFPVIKHEKKPGIDVVIAPVAGWDNKRKFNGTVLRNFVVSIPKHRHLTYVGRGNKTYRNSIANLRGNSLLNATTAKELVDVVCSAKVVIGNPGFITYLACMAGKKVFSTREAFSRSYFHPKWNANFITRLMDVGRL